MNQSPLNELLLDQVKMISFHGLSIEVILATDVKKIFRFESRADMDRAVEGWLKGDSAHTSQDLTPQPPQFFN